MAEGDGLISKNQYRHDLCLLQMLGGFPVCPAVQGDQSKMIYSPAALGNLPRQAPLDKQNWLAAIMWKASAGRYVCLASTGSSISRH